MKARKIPQRLPDNPFAARADYELTPEDMTPNPDTGRLFDANKMPTLVESRRASFWDTMPTIYSDITKGAGADREKAVARKREQKTHVVRSLAENTTVEPAHLEGLSEIKFARGSGGGGHYTARDKAIEVRVNDGDTVDLNEVGQTDNYGLSTLVHEIGHHVSHSWRSEKDDLWENNHVGRSHINSLRHPNVAGPVTGNQLPEEEAFADDYLRLNYERPTNSYGDRIALQESGVQVKGINPPHVASPEFIERYKGARQEYPISNTQFGRALEQRDSEAAQGRLFDLPPRADWNSVET
jgi:hypothetical protein